MNFKQLSTFLLVADMHSLSRAAIASDTAQSLVSRQISTLEAQWGRRLFDRTGRGMALSDFGRQMYPEVKRLVDQMGQLDALAREAAGVLTGTVHVGVLPSMSRQLLPMLLAEVRETAPALRLHVMEGFSGTLDEQLASGRLDMIVVNRYGSSALSGEDVLGKVDTFLVGKPGSHQLAGSTIAFRDLAGIPFVLPATPNGLRTTVDMLARKHGIAIDVLMEVDTSTAMKDVAMGGHAFTLLPVTAIREELLAGTLAAVRVARPGIRRTIALSLTRHHPLSQGARLVASRVRHLAVELLKRSEEWQQAAT
jgi:LysR family transcriptional regulator, nitrogen assimilation regulatory protein